MEGNPVPIISLVALAVFALLLSPFVFPKSRPAEVLGLAAKRLRQFSSAIDALFSSATRVMESWRVLALPFIALIVYRESSGLFFNWLATLGDTFSPLLLGNFITFVHTSFTVGITCWIMRRLMQVDIGDSPWPRRVGTWIAIVIVLTTFHIGFGSNVSFLISNSVQSLLSIRIDWLQSLRFMPLMFWIHIALASLLFVGSIAAMPAVPQALVGRRLDLGSNYRAPILFGLWSILPLILTLIVTTPLFVVLNDFRFWILGMMPFGFGFDFVRIGFTSIFVVINALIFIWTCAVLVDVSQRAWAAVHSDQPS